MLYKAKAQNAQALDQWAKLAAKEVVDPDFEGVKEAVSFMALLEDEDLIWKNVPWVFQADALEAVRVRACLPFELSNIISCIRTCFCCPRYSWQKERLYSSTLTEFLISWPPKEEARFSGSSLSTSSTPRKHR